MSHTRTVLLLGALLVSGCASQTALINPTELNRLTRCDAPLAQVRQHLVAAGYEIAEETERGFHTQFKPVPEENETFMLGTLSDSYQRRYEVEALSETASRYRVIYRHTRHPHSTDEAEEPTTREGPRTWHPDQQALLEQIQQQVCYGVATTEKEGREAPSTATMDYLLERCRGGDQLACDLLRPQGKPSP